MGYRLTSITTKTGDHGTTSLANGRRVEKDSPYIQMLGVVDELNSVLGMLVSSGLGEHERHQVALIQNELFELGTELSSPGRVSLTKDSVERLEAEIKTYNESLKPLEEFILPGGCMPAAICHMARASCRTAEREMVTLGSLDPQPESQRLVYLNRLSDYLFVLARAINLQNGSSEICWQPKVKRPA